MENVEVELVFFVLLTDVLARFAFRSTETTAVGLPAQ